MTVAPEQQRALDALFATFCATAEGEGWTLRGTDNPPIPLGSRHATFSRGAERLEALSVGVPTGPGLYVFTFQDAAA
jgi:hypothetical protein